MGPDVFGNHKLGFTVYYLGGTTGWPNGRFPEGINFHGYLAARETTAPRISNIWSRDNLPLQGLNFGVGRMSGAPTVIPIEKGHSKFYDNSTDLFKMWFTVTTTGVYGIDIYYAESRDGVTWQAMGTGIDNYDSPFVIKDDNSTYHMYGAKVSLPDPYNQIDEFTSTDGRSWVLAHEAVITRGSEGTWNHGVVAKTGGAIDNGTFYLYVEGYDVPYADGGWTQSAGLYTTTDFHTFTPNAGNPLGANLGYAALYKASNGSWYTWGTLTLSAPGADITRFKAPSITGPWIQESSAPTMPRLTQDEGIGSYTGQTANPAIIEHQGKTYFYFNTNNDWSVTIDSQTYIKLAIANMPIAQLVQMEEYEYSLSYLLFITSTPLWPK